MLTEFFKSEDGSLLIKEQHSTDLSLVLVDDLCWNLLDDEYMYTTIMRLEGGEKQAPKKAQKN